MDDNGADERVAGGGARCWGLCGGGGGGLRCASFCIVKLVM